MQMEHLPVTWQRLMCDPESDIIDFYPTDFKIDLNGKKYAWQGVALLPFVDENRLRKALQSVYPDLTDGEKSRNVWGSDRLFVGQKHPSHAFYVALYEGEWTTEEQEVFTDTKLNQGMKGQVWCDKFVCIPGETLRSPLPALSDLEENQAICVCFKDLQFDIDFIFPAKVLPGAVKPPPTLKPEDFNKKFPGRPYRPQLGFQPHSGYRPAGSSNPAAAQRFIRGNLSSDRQPGVYGNVPPPSRQAGETYHRQNRFDQDYNNGRNQRYGDRNQRQYQDQQNQRRDHGGWNQQNRGFQQQSFSGQFRPQGGIGSHYAGTNVQQYNTAAYNRRDDARSRDNQRGGYGTYGYGNNQRGHGGGGYSQYNRRY